MDNQDSTAEAESNEPVAVAETDDSPVTEDQAVDNGSEEGKVPVEHEKDSLKPTEVENAAEDDKPKTQPEELAKDTQSLATKPNPPSEIATSAYGSTFPSLMKYKLVFLGDLGVGKTSIITRFMFDSFETDYVATIGIDFLSKTLALEDRTIRLQLWDTAGQERFKTLIPAYIRDSTVAVIVFDVTSKESLESSKKWIDDAKNERNNDILIVLVGNKCDVEEEEREVSLEEGKAVAEEKATLYIETSAKQGYNVKALFNQIAANLPGVENVAAAPEQPPEKLNLEPLETPEESSCAC